jgi:hypothetical protein
MIPVSESGSSRGNLIPCVSLGKEKGELDVVLAMEKHVELESVWELDPISTL